MTVISLIDKSNNATSRQEQASTNPESGENCIQFGKATNERVEDVGDVPGKENELDSSAFPTDVFTMIIFAKPTSPPFFYGMMVFVLQIMILTVISVDLISDDDIRPGLETDRNPLNVPIDVERPVRIAQAIAILIICISNTDVTESIEILAIGWKPFLLGLFPTATRTKFVVANLLRILEGFFVTAASFIFIVQASDVLEIFLNFAAVQFVASLDDLAYMLASGGWVGRSMKHFNASIEGIRLPAEEKSEWIRICKPLLVTFFLVGLYLTYVVIGTRQENGTILSKTSCRVVDVQFGDEVYRFNEEDNYEFETTSVDNPLDYSPYLIGDVSNSAEYNGDAKTIVGSNRVLGQSFNASKPPDLHYAYFSGTYRADFNNRESDRPTYVEDGYQDITAGMFYYCDEVKSWVFTIRAFRETGAMPGIGRITCKYGWLMGSPVTEAFTLDSAPTEGWKVWTGVLESAPDFSVTCTDCYTDFDCGMPARGKCIDRQCHCVPGVAEGHFCQEEAACDDLLAFVSDDGSHDGCPFPPPEIEGQRTYRNIRSVLGGEATIHSRPAYYLKLSEWYELVFFTGRRWYGAYFDLSEFPIETADTTAKREYFQRFHAYWNNVLFTNVKGISERTDRHLPTGSIQWSFFHSSKSMSYGPFPTSTNVFGTFHCYSVDCNIYNVCGNYGNCVERETIVEADGYELNGNQCVCERGCGSFCHFDCEVANDCSTFVAPGWPTRTPTADAFGPSPLPTAVPSEKPVSTKAPSAVYGFGGGTAPGAVTSESPSEKRVPTEAPSDKSSSPTFSPSNPFRICLRPRGCGT